MDQVTNESSRIILGIRFFAGSVGEAVDRMLRGGLLVVPAAPALKDLPTHSNYRQAILSADIAIPDSAFMVLAWNFLEGDDLRRVSGLEYLKALLAHADVRAPGKTLWVMAGERSSRRNLAWLQRQGIDVPRPYVYLAPMYGSEIDDPTILERIERLQPAHVIIAIGGGNQERLGLYLRQYLSFLPGIHCIGAAIAFLSGDQVRIPMWADRMYLGWLFRVLDDPKRFIPRYWEARVLFSLMHEHRSKLPPLIEVSQVQVQYEVT